MLHWKLSKLEIKRINEYSLFHYKKVSKLWIVGLGKTWLVKRMTKCSIEGKLNFIAVVKETADNNLISALKSWISSHYPPAIIFALTSDGGYAALPWELSMELNYTVLLACLSHTPEHLRCASNLEWNWTELFKGKLVGQKVTFYLLFFIFFTTLTWLNLNYSLNLWKLFSTNCSVIINWIRTMTTSHAE